MLKKGNTYVDLDATIGRHLATKILEAFNIPTACPVTVKLEGLTVFTFNYEVLLTYRRGAIG